LPRQVADGIAGEDRRHAFVGEAPDHEAMTYRLTVRRSSFIVPLIGTAPGAGSASPLPIPWAMPPMVMPRTIFRLITVPQS
jgi:hypothetical protein